MTVRRRIFEIVEAGKREDLLSRIFDSALIALIFLNVAAIVLESFHEISAKYGPLLRAFEQMSIGLFTAEYLLRVATADYMRPRLGPWAARARWMFSLQGIVDLLAIAPFFIPLLIPFDLRFIRMIRVLRLLRIFKMQRYSRSMRIIGHILNEKKEELVTTFFISGILMIVASTFMYYLENEAQPNAFPNVLATMWWAVATLTTVGYGDVFPVTTAGKIFAGLISILGIGIIALPTGILSAAFVERIKADRPAEGPRETKYCPHCGKELER